MLLFTNSQTDQGAQPVLMNGMAENGHGSARQPSPDRKHTQEDQNHADERARRNAMKDLSQSWMDRLQLISVITTFFASTEAGLLSVVTPDTKDDSTRLEQASSAGLMGALLIHVFASIISFLAAFFLVRYNLSEAKKEEQKVVGEIIESPISDVEKAVNGRPQNRSPSKSNTPHRTIRVDTEPPIWSSDPHLEQVGPFHRNPPTHLLSRCHSLCILLAAVGFVLALMGIICYAWSRFPASVSVFATVCMGFCVASAVLIIFGPG